jgi:hypothetical protein
MERRGLDQEKDGEECARAGGNRLMGFHSPQFRRLGAPVEN